ncbi:Protein IWS1 -like protein IWS1-like protein [Channa argus]|uniref:Protein IWS1-like protein IWS1-like protein n=1 Tax=Channa argus TaxID=215402 RepID=A0A6G1PTT8_CHAAH|nr:Protein IWS1 -like protein IWS1-like protein [Channa argus]
MVELYSTQMCFSLLSSVVKRSRAVSDDENSDSEAELGGPDKSLAAKLKELGSDSESEDDRSKATSGKKDEKALFGSDSDSGGDDEEEKMIADIFGESGDEEEEEFTLDTLITTYKTQDIAASVMELKLDDADETWYPLMSIPSSPASSPTVIWEALVEDNVLHSRGDFNPDHICSFLNLCLNKTYFTYRGDFYRPPLKPKKEDGHLRTALKACAYPKWALNKMVSRSNRRTIDRAETQSQRKNLGFNQEDLEAEKKESKEMKQQVDEDSESDDGVDRSGQDTSFMSDFDIMLARRKAMNSRKRRHRDGGTFISDADDVVSAMITKMNEAAEEDRTLNSQKKPALKKLTLLPQVVMHLKKQDLKETFIDSGVMSAIKEWISPLPDKSLPALRIREELLRILQELPNVSQETLKHSGIGRAVMFLYKHPKESRSNKDLALKLINEWSRPIFGLTSNYKGMTREERQQRDLDQQMPQRRRLSSGGQTPRRDLEKQLTGEEKALRPGDPGFCARARVPMPSNKDYVVRPKWNVEVESSRGPMKKGLSRVDKQMRRFADIRRLTKPGHAVKISVEGNRMPL